METLCKRVELMTYCTYLVMHPPVQDPFKRPVFVCFGSRTNLELIAPAKLSHRQQTPSVTNKSTNLHRLTDCETRIRRDNG